MGLHSGPYANVEEIPSRIRGLGTKFDERSKSEDTDDGDTISSGSENQAINTFSDIDGNKHSQSTHAKHHGDSNLLSPIQSETPQLPQRYSQHPDI